MKQTISIYLDQAVIDNLKRAAKSEGRTLSNYLNNLLQPPTLARQNQKDERDTNKGRKNGRKAGDHSNDVLAGS